MDTFIRKVRLLLLFSALSASTSAQDLWTTYYSYKQCFNIAENTNFIMGASNLGLTLYHKETNSVSAKNKVNGLSDSEISAINSSPDDDIILIGYENGNIDVITDEGTYNIPDLRIQNMAGSKKTNHFLLHDDGRVFCSTDFGILELNISKKEIASTFIIGDEASYLKVNKTVVKDDTIYAATSSGLMMADMNKTLSYYENWELLSEDRSPFCDVESKPSGIVAAKGEKGSTCQLLLFNSSGASALSSYGRFQNIRPTEDGYIITTQNRIYFTNSQLETTSTQDTIIIQTQDEYMPVYRDAFIAEDQTLWLADWNGGLFHKTTSGKYQQVLPPGPYSNSTYKTKKINDELWIVPGGFGALHNNANIPASVSVQKNGEWTYFTRSNTPEFKNARDLINIEVNPFNPDNVFISSWGNGVFEFKKSNDTIYLATQYTDENSELTNFPGAPPGRYIRVWGMAFDSDGNLFMNCSSITWIFAVYNVLENVWYKYDYADITEGDQKNGEIIIDNNGYKWLPVLHGQKGIFVFDDNGTIDNSSDDRYRGILNREQDPDPRNKGPLKLWDENGEEIIEGAFCIEKDKNGYLWFGTENGVVVQYNPGQIFDTEQPVFSKIKVPRNDGSGLADYLLEGIRITAIAVDGANRKYFGTEGNGIYLISEDGTQTIAHFNTSNSPIPSDNIFNIDIDESTGEVFFATDKGLISYRGSAVKGEKTFSNVYVYPNPVRPEHEGPITITGLIDRTNVKITDTSGNLVYETISLGGNAFWNGKNLYGEKVKSGIYIIFLASPDGSQNGSAKVAIIR